MKWGVVIVAAGRGTRLGRPKQLLNVAGLPLVGWCMRTFASVPEICAAVVVTEQEHVEAMRSLTARMFASTPCLVVTGGRTRQESVRCGLDALPPSCAAVLVHDGARPLVTASDVRAGMTQVRPGRGAVLATPVVDTVKVVTETTMMVERTLDRSTLWAAQTPQFAMVEDLRRAHTDARAHGIVVTDDVGLLERLGMEVAVVPASGENFKVTLPDDIARAEVLLNDRLDGWSARVSGAGT
jgi:2-C-methyl-D-erythritol 4-phosphate cytidylyltransferase